MANFQSSPNMNLPIPVVGVDSGPDYANNVDASLLTIDSHNHLPGSGVPIPVAALNINANLPLAGYWLSTTGAIQFNALSSTLSTANLNCLYVSGVDLYFNDGSGDTPIQITKSGSVHATSSGISFSTASAAFNGSLVLVVNEASGTPGNIQAGSLLLGQNVAGSNFLTLSPPASLSGGSFGLVLPAIPASQSFLTVDTSGNITGYAPIANGLTASNLASGTLTGTQMASNNNLPGNAVQENGLNLVVSANAGTGTSLKIIRGYVNSSGTAIFGEGFTSSGSAGTYTVNFSTAFSSPPAVTVSAVTSAYYDIHAFVDSISDSAVVIRTAYTATVGLFANDFTFIAVGPR